MPGMSGLQNVNLISRTF